MNLSAFRYRLAHLPKRIGQAYRLVRWRLTQEDARDLYFTVTQRAGWHPLITIDDESVAERLAETFAPDPRFEMLAERAAARVASKWSDDGETRSAAVEWAIGLCEEYAKDSGFPLQRAAFEDVETEETSS